MPARKKNDQAALPGMPSMADLRDTLWKAADKLRGSMDAAQYKDFVLGLVFLKYVSDSFEERREQIRADVLADGVPESRLAPFLDDVDEYKREGVFWVPEGARWDWLAEQAKSVGIGELIDNAMDAIMKTNASLTGVLPKIFNRDNVDQRRLGELVDLISDARFTGHGEKKARDVLGEVYEYFLEKFARAEGKRGGEFYTPSSVVSLLVAAAGTLRGPGLRPVLRLGRHVRPGGEVRPRAPRPPRRHRRLRPGVQRANLAPGQDEPRHPRHLRRPQQPLGRHLLRRQAPRHQGRLHPRQPPLQHVRLGPPHRRPALALRRPARQITRTSPGLSTSSTSSVLVVRQAWCWPMDPCRPKQSGEGDIRAALVDKAITGGSGSGVVHDRFAATTVPNDGDTRLPLVLRKR